MASWFQLGIADFTVVGLIGLLSGAIGGWFAKYLFPKLLQERKHELEDRSETHRFRLKRHELLFEREFSAVEKLFVFYESTLSFQAGPYDDDPDHFGSIVAPSLGGIDEQLTALIKNHGTVLSDETLDLLHSARSEARLGFTSYCEDIAPADTGPDYSPSKSTMKHLRAFADHLYGARQQARADLSARALANKKAE